MMKPSLSSRKLWALHWLKTPLSVMTNAGWLSRQQDQTVRHSCSPKRQTLSSNLISVIKQAGAYFCLCIQAISGMTITVCNPMAYSLPRNLARKRMDWWSCSWTFMAINGILFNRIILFQGTNKKQRAFPTHLLPAGKGTRPTGVILLSSLIEIRACKLTQLRSPRKRTGMRIWLNWVY